MTEEPQAWKFHQLDVYKKTASVDFQVTKSFGCIFNEAKLNTLKHVTCQQSVSSQETGAKTKKGNSPSPASAGSSGAKISRFALDMAMKNNTAVAPLENIYWHTPTAELTDFISLTTHPGLHEHGELKWFSFLPLCDIFEEIWLSFMKRERPEWRKL